MKANGDRTSSNANKNNAINWAYVHTICAISTTQVFRLIAAKSTYREKENLQFDLVLFQ